MHRWFLTVLNVVEIPRSTNSKVKLIYKYCNRKLKVCIRFVSSNSRAAWSSKTVGTFLIIFQSFYRVGKPGIYSGEMNIVWIKLTLEMILKSLGTVSSIFALWKMNSIQFNGKSFHYFQNLTIFDQKYLKCLILDTSTSNESLICKYVSWAVALRVLICL